MNKFLLLIAFISGLAIMAMEISAARLLAPYFGASLFVWTNIIAVVLAALSLGYYLGGKLADYKPELNILLKLILIAGIIFLTIPWTVQSLISLIALDLLILKSASVIIFISSLIAALLLFALPLMLLGMVSPFIIKLSFLSNKQVGEAAGSVFALSTLGSILGVFLPTLWFIPFIGTRMTISIFAVSLIVLASFGLFTKKSRLFLLLVLFLPLSGADKIIKPEPGLLFEDESAYQYIQVIQDKANNIYLIFNEGIGIQSVYNDSQILTGAYYDYFNLLPYLVNSEADSDRKKRILILGLAGGTVSRQMDYFFRGEIEIDGVEIDKKVIELAKEYFDLTNPSLTVYNQDGRIFLENSAKKYDVIIVDAYAQQLYIPWTLTTQEFWEAVKNKLAPGGIMAINVNATSPESELLQTIANTMASIFDYTFMTRIKDGWNFMLLASPKNISFQALPELVKNEQLKELADLTALKTILIRFKAEKLILTDDRAPIEFMTEKMIFSYLINNLD